MAASRTVLPNGSGFDDRFKTTSDRKYISLMSSFAL